MPVQFSCPRCGAALSAADASQSIRCPACDADVAVPVMAASAGASAADDDEEENEGDDEPIAFRKTQPVADAEMDMTPMVDVTFLLLIFFMVTAAFALQKSLEIPKPEPKDDQAQARTFQQLEDNPDYITVYVDRYGAYRVVTADWDLEVFSEPELLRHLTKARQGLSNGTIPTHLVVRAEGDAAHGKVVSALDAGTAVGVEDVQLVTIEETTE